MKHWFQTIFTVNLLYIQIIAAKNNHILKPKSLIKKGVLSWQKTLKKESDFARIRFNLLPAIEKESSKR